MARRKNGHGSVFYDAARGCWIGQLSIGRDPETGRRKRGPKVYGATERECDEALDEMRRELRQTGTVAPRDVTVAMITADLLANPPARWAAPGTLRANRDRLARVDRALGGVKLLRLTVGQVEKMLRDLAAAGTSADGLRRSRWLLALAIRRAQRDGLVHRNVAELADVPRGGRRVSKAMTLDQVKALLALKMTPFWRAYVVAGLTCGLRPGELLGLRWQDVTDGTLRVRTCLKPVPGPDGKRVLVLAELKTERSRRTMQLPRDAATVLRALRAQQARDRLALGADYQDSDLVFAAPTGKPRWPQDVRKGFGTLCERAQLGTGWHPHEMRHTWVSLLSDAGTDIEDIADAAGHINSSVTRNVYRHQLADRLTRASQAMDSILSAGDVTGA